MDVEVVFQNLIFPIQFVLVSNLAGPALLGTDFLSKYRVKLDFFNNEIIMYKNINSKITFNFKPKSNNILNSCAIFDDNLKQNTQCLETNQIKTVVNTDNNKVNTLNINDHNENIILLERLAKKINNSNEKSLPFYKEKSKIKDFEINNIILYETKKI